jgi:hypothetical protein
MTDAPALQTLGGAAAGTAIGYAIAGRSGGVVGALLGGVLGYQIGPFGELVAGATRGEVRRAEPILRSARSGGRDTGDSAAVRLETDLRKPSVARNTAAEVGETVDRDVWRERIRQQGYDPEAVIVPSLELDPYGSIRVVRNPEWELRSILGDYDETLRAVIGVVTLGITEILIRVNADTRRRDVLASIARFPTRIIWSPDYLPARWPPKFGDDGLAFTDADRARMLELYGPTEADVIAAVRENRYVASVQGQPVVIAAETAWRSGIQDG